jgi:lactate dehydrogenase-like 2-hydroxyacid dehydrogenase
VVGLGRIGLAVARRAHLGFGMRIIYYNPSQPPQEALEGLDAERCDSLEALLRSADFVSLHCPSNPQTHHLMNEDRFALMRDNAFLINTARGNVVDPAALVSALGSGQIAGAGLDVYEEEPAVPEALLGLENVMLLPHLGSATVETRVAMGMRVAENLQAFFSGHEPADRLV